MATKIEWTDDSWNPIVGCSKVSPGCENCYAERMANRLAAMNTSGYQSVIDGHWDGDWNKHVCNGWNGQTAFVESALEKPLHWKKPRRIFVCSMGDLFHESVPFEWIDKVFAVMALCPQHTFQVLTKRPQRMLEYMTSQNRDCPPGGMELFNKWETHACIGFLADVEVYGKEFQWPLPNVWLGVTAENQEMADQRIPILLQIPAAKRFVSVEPMLGKVKLTDIWWKTNGLGELHENFEAHVGVDWVIVGCESLPGGKASVRGFDSESAWWEAAYSVYDKCKDADVPFFFKQGPIDGRVVKPDKHPELVPKWALTQEFSST